MSFVLSSHASVVPRLRQPGQLQRARRGTSLVTAAKRAAKEQDEDQELQYGSGWFEATKRLSKPISRSKTKEVLGASGDQL